MLHFLLIHSSQALQLKEREEQCLCVCVRERERDCSGGFSHLNWLLLSLYQVQTLNLSYKIKTVKERENKNQIGKHFTFTQRIDRRAKKNVKKNITTFPR